MAAKNFSFRLSAEGAEQVVGAFRQVAGTSAELQAAYTRLIQSSPQLASVADGVRAKMNATATAMRGSAVAAKEAGGSFSSFGSLLGSGGVVGIGIGFGLSAIESLIERVKALATALPLAGDEFKLISARLENVTGSVESASRVYDRLLAISRQTGVSVADSAAAFGRFSIAAKDLGATNEQVLALVGGLQKFGAISGSSTQETAAATQQLAQALASGKLQGDELRSILENMPALAQSLARELGTSLGNLREMGTEGKLTADVIFPALLRAVEGVDAKFQALPSNIARSSAAATTSTNALLAALDNALGISTRIAAQFDRTALGADRIRRAFGFLNDGEAQASRLSRIGEIDSRLATLTERRPRVEGQNRFGLLKLDEEIATLRRERDTLLEAAAAADIKANDAARADVSGAQSNRLAAVVSNAENYKPPETKEAKAAVDTYAASLENLASVMAGLREKESGQLADDLTKITDRLDPTSAATRRLSEDLIVLQRAAADGLISAEQLASMTDKLNAPAEKADRSFDSFFAKISSGFEDAVVRGEKFGGVVRALEQDIAKLILRAAITDPLSKSVSGFLGDSGGLSGLFKTGASFLGSLFADGGVMTPAGPLPLRRYASGGIANSPQLAMFGEGRMPEAYVPLPDGRSIPVRMQGGGGSVINHAGVTVNVSNTNASAEQIAQTVELASQRANADLLASIERGGSTAKQVGRRR